MIRLTRKEKHFRPLRIGNVPVMGGFFVRKSIAFIALFTLLLGSAICAQAELRVVGSASNLELMTNLVIAFVAKTGIPVDLRGPGSVEGLHQLTTGKANVAYISRPLSDGEKALGLVGTPYCRDAVAIVVHPASRIENLTRGELKNIFTGNRLKWDDGSRIVVLIRDGFSGTRQLFEEKIMEGEAFAAANLLTETKGKGIMFSPISSTFHPPFFPLIKKDDELIFYLARIRGAIAYHSIEGLPKESRVIKVDGVQPTRENIKNGSYLLSRTPQLVTMGKPVGQVKQLIDFIVNEGQQKIVERMGYIPINE